MTISIRKVALFAACAILLYTGCDSNSEDTCLTVTPNEDYEISGTAMDTDFVPDSKTYVVSNTCSGDVMLSVEEDVRWLDVEIDSFPGDDEAGPLAAGSDLDVRIEVRYGTDNPERLNQLAAGSYSAELRFRDTSNNTQVVQSVNLTVNTPLTPQ